jgi:integrase
MPLTDAAIRAAKPLEKPYKLFDGGGLYALINPDSSRWWRLKYRYAGKERLLSLGVYPAVKLKEARDRRDDAKRQLRDGIDPSAVRQAQKAARVDAESGSFEVVAREWYARQSPKWADSFKSKVLRRLERDVFPKIGRKPIGDLKAPEVLAILRNVEERGTVETAHRIRQSLGQIFRYAVATHRADSDPTANLRGALAAVPDRHHASITDPKQVGPLIRALRHYSGTEVTKCALRLAPLLFVRPGELRQAKWSEFAFDLEPPLKSKETVAEWRIPAERMKMREQHIVPLSRQAVEILRELHAVTGPDGYLFPSVRTRSRSMSENTLNAALRRLDYGKDEMTGHGFRSMASTILHEQGWRSEIIERQLAHGDRNSVRAAYNFAEHLPDRRRMMQEWADFLDGLAKSGN